MVVSKTVLDWYLITLGFFVCLFVFGNMYLWEYIIPSSPIQVLQIHFLK